jgi:UDP-N-acetylmuramate: L-alanyl-gamma-D-glutamyl-meso-diaminopimelate ligase
MSTQLEEQGIELVSGYDAGQLTLAPDLFVVGNAISRGNPLLEAILERNLAYVSGPQWLAENILRGAGCWAWRGRTARPPRHPC